MEATSKDIIPPVVAQPSHSLPGEVAHPLLHIFLQKRTSYLIEDAKAALIGFQTCAIPLPIITYILGHLLIFPQPITVGRHASISQRDSNINSLSVLRACRLFYQTGIPLLYGMNTITAPSPATSYDFDDHLAGIPGKNRQLITNVKLEIDWADDLWTKFPLLAQQLGQLPLRQLTIILTYKNKHLEQQIPGLVDKATNQQVLLSEKAAKHIKMSHGMAEAQVRAEKKMLRGLVDDIRTLKVFRLEGFRDQAFADNLQGRMIYR